MLNMRIAGPYTTYLLQLEKQITRHGAPGADDVPEVTNYLPMRRVTAADTDPFHC